MQLHSTEAAKYMSMKKFAWIPKGKGGYTLAHTDITPVYVYVGIALRYKNKSLCILSLKPKN